MNKIEQIAKIFGVEIGEEFTLTTTPFGKLLGYPEPSQDIYRFDVELVRKGFDDGWSCWYGGNAVILNSMIIGIYEIGDRHEND